MKDILTLPLVLVLYVSMSFFIQNVSAEDVFSDAYNKSDLVLTGKVLSLEQRHNATIYEVQVEKYYKNPQSAKAIAVFGPAKGIYYMQDPTFEVGDRLFLYLEKQNGVWAIQSLSFKLQYNCDASILAPSAFDIYARGMPASDDSPTFSDADFIGDIHKVGNKMKIKYTVHNYTPFIKHATVTLLVNGTNQNKTVFSDQKTVIIPACNGSVPLEWDFTPQRADDYVAQTKVTAGYDTQRFLMIRDEPYVANSFQARENVSGGSIDKTIHPIIKSPLQQFKSGVQINQIQCNHDYVVLLKPNREFAGCFSSDSAMKLYTRGWPSPNDSVGIFQKQDSRVRIAKDVGNQEDIMLINDKPFYYYTINETLNSAHGEGKKINFHDVTFTLFPRPKTMNLGGFCGSGSLGTGILFSDGVREKLSINIPEMECMDKFTKADLTKLTNHTNPQAGLTFFDDKVRLLVRSDSNNQTNGNTTEELPLDNKSFPHDFGVVYSFGVGGKNVLDTKKMSYKADMVCEPEIEINLELSHSELYQIWDRAHKNDFFDLSNFTDNCDSFGNCKQVTPESQTTITITEGGKTHSVTHRESYVPRSNDGYAKFQNIANTIQGMLDKKPVIQSLPQLKCAYQ